MVRWVRWVGEVGGVGGWVGGNGGERRQMAGTHPTKTHEKTKRRTRKPPFIGAFAVRCLLIDAQQEIQRKAYFAKPELGVQDVGFCWFRGAGFCEVVDCLFLPF